MLRSKPNQACFLKSLYHSQATSEFKVVQTPFWALVPQEYKYIRKHKAWRLTGQYHLPVSFNNFLLPGFAEHGLFTVMEPGEAVT